VRERERGRWRKTRKTRRRSRGRVCIHHPTARGRLGRWRSRRPEPRRSRRRRAARPAPATHPLDSQHSMRANPVERKCVQVAPCSTGRWLPGRRPRATAAEKSSSGSIASYDPSRLRQILRTWAPTRPRWPRWVGFQHRAWAQGLAPSPLPEGILPGLRELKGAHAAVQAIENDPGGIVVRRRLSHKEPRPGAPGDAGPLRAACTAAAAGTPACLGAREHRWSQQRRGRACAGGLRAGRGAHPTALRKPIVLMWRSQVVCRRTLGGEGGRGGRGGAGCSGTVGARSGSKPGGRRQRLRRRRGRRREHRWRTAAEAAKIQEEQ
jgi:hypothetical protein